MSHILPFGAALQGQSQWETEVDKGHREKERKRERVRTSKCIFINIWFWLFSSVNYIMCLCALRAPVCMYVCYYIDHTPLKFYERAREGQTDRDPE